MSDEVKCEGEVQGVLVPGGGGERWYERCVVCEASGMSVPSPHDKDRDYD